jgi:hypothetical protein
MTHLIRKLFGPELYQGWGNVILFKNSRRLATMFMAFYITFRYQMSNYHPHLCRGQISGFESRRGPGIFLNDTVSRPALGPPSLLSSGSRGSFPGGKVVGTWSWLLTSNYCRGQEYVELYRPSVSQESNPGPPKCEIWLVNWLKLLLRISEGPGLNLGPEADCPEIFMLFLTPSRKMVGFYLKIFHNCVLPHYFRSLFARILPFNTV